MQQLKNPCIRCGQDRVMVKTWNETIGTSLVTYTLSRCPDADCQKIVDKQNAEREAKRLLHLHKQTNHGAHLRNKISTGKN